VIGVFDRGEAVVASINHQGEGVSLIAEYCTQCEIEKSNRVSAKIP
jgi:hypothetical protein